MANEKQPNNIYNSDNNNNFYNSSKNNNNVQYLTESRRIGFTDFQNNDDVILYRWALYPNLTR